MTKITGKVFKESSKPAGGITVRCGEKEVRTLFDGTYTFIDVKPGPHIIKVHLEGYDESPVNVSVDEGQEAVQDISLTPAKGNGKIWGHIYVEETGEPANKSGSVMMIETTSNKIASVGPHNGYYEFIDLTAGVYTLWSSILDYEDQKKVVDLAEDEEKEIVFLLKRKEEQEVPWG
ncbi:MAG: carboxypeptidase regulatory-like domain-containing protein [Pseudomonadota bacterium]